MPFSLLASFSEVLGPILQGLVMTVFILSCLVLIVVILLQEGKGGGIAGAFGGAGAEAFGVKAGTVNRFTAWVAGLFLVLALLHVGLKAWFAQPADLAKPSVVPASSDTSGDGGTPPAVPATAPAGGVPPAEPVPPTEPVPPAPGVPPAVPPASPPANPAAPKPPEPTPVPAPVPPADPKPPEPAPAPAPAEPAPAPVPEPTPPAMEG